jgi:hypothetical protein
MSELQIRCFAALPTYGNGFSLHALRSPVQVVQQINKRSGSDFEAQYVTNPNGHGDPDTNGIENACELDSVRSMFNESTLYAIASQYSMDVMGFGYM